jgi:cobalamin biosynthesis protein CbiD
MREGGAAVLVRVPLEDGDAFFIAVKSSAETFESSITRVRHIAEVIVDKLSGLPVAPSSIRAEFGVCLTAEAGIGIAKGTGEAHFVIELEWSPKPQP